MYWEKSREKGINQVFRGFKEKDIQKDLLRSRKKGEKKQLVGKKSRELQ